MEPLLYYRPPGVIKFWGHRVPILSPPRTAEIHRSLCDSCYTNAGMMYHAVSLASFPGPAQLSVAFSTVKRGEPGIFSHVSMT